jgi:predicted XRE-type DNA-binding protein
MLGPAAVGVTKSAVSAVSTAKCEDFAKAKLPEMLFERPRAA